MSPHNGKTGNRASPDSSELYDLINPSHASPSYLKHGLYRGKKRLCRITCFFVDRDFRGKGLAGYPLMSALASIRKRGGEIVEAYPLESIHDIARKTKGKASFLWSGTVPMFREKGFKVVAPLGKSRRLVRRTIS